MASASTDSGYVDNWQAGKTVTECNLHMLTTEDCSDVIFRVGSEKHVVRAHRYVLVSRSCVFHAMFCGPLAENGEITIPDIEQHVFREFIKYLYTDSVTITADTVTGLLYTSRKYAVDGLLKQCSSFLENSLSEETVCRILEQCHSYGEQDLEQKALKILTEAGDKVIKSQGFCSLCSNCLDTFLKSDELKLKEEDVFESTLSWTKEQCMRENIATSPENLRRVLGDMRYEIRFACMPLIYIVKAVGPSGLLSAVERVLIMDKIVDPDVEGLLFKSGQRKGLAAIQENIVVHRFQNVTTHWDVSSGKDAVSFTASKNINLVGCQLFGPWNKDESIYSLNICIFDDKCQQISVPVPQSEWKLKGHHELNSVMFPVPVLLVAGRTYTICVTMKGVNTYYGTEGQTSVIVDGVEFTFNDSPMSSKGWSTSKRGQIPGLIVQLL